MNMGGRIDLLGRCTTTDPRVRHVLQACVDASLTYCMILYTGQNIQVCAFLFVYYMYTRTLLLTYITSLDAV